MVIPVNKMGNKKLGVHCTRYMVRWKDVLQDNRHNSLGQCTYLVPLIAALSIATTVVGADILAKLCIPFHDRKVGTAMHSSLVFLSSRKAP